MQLLLKSYISQATRDGTKSAYHTFSAHVRQYVEESWPNSIEQNYMDALFWPPDVTILAMARIWSKQWQEIGLNDCSRLTVRNK